MSPVGQVCPSTFNSMCAASGLADLQVWDLVVLPKVMAPGGRPQVASLKRLVGSFAMAFSQMATSSAGASAGYR